MSTTTLLFLLPILAAASAANSTPRARTCGVEGLPDCPSLDPASLLIAGVTVAIVVAVLFFLGRWRRG